MSSVRQRRQAGSGGRRRHHAPVQVAEALAVTQRDARSARSHPRLPRLRKGGTCSLATTGGQQLRRWETATSDRGQGCGRRTRRQQLGRQAAFCRRRRQPGRHRRDASHLRPMPQRSLHLSSLHPRPPLIAVTVVTWAMLGHVTCCQTTYCLPSTRATQRHASAALPSACRACTSRKWLRRTSSGMPSSANLKSCTGRRKKLLKSELPPPVWSAKLAWQGSWH